MPERWSSEDASSFARRVLEGVQLAVTVWEKNEAEGEADYLLRWANPAASRSYGVDLGARAGARFFDVFPAASPMHVELLDRAIESESSVSLGDLVSDHSDRILAARALALGDRLVATVTEDVTEVRRTSAALERTAAELQDLYEQAPVAHHSLDADGVFLRINDTALAWLGYARDELVGKKRFSDLLTSEGLATFAASFPAFKARGFVRDLEFDLIRKDGTVLPVLLSSTAVRDAQGRYVKSRSTMIDISARRRAEAAVRRAFAEVEARVEERTRELAQTNEALRHQMVEREKALAALARSEEQLRHAQKMDAVGRLAGGIAHDFNNMLSVILGFTELVLTDLPEGDPRREDLSQALAAANRSAALTQQLLAFSRQQMAQPEPVDVNATLSELERMLQRLLGENIRLVTRFGEVGQVLADRGQLEQVVVNLAVNARDAMPHGGTLVIETLSIELDTAYAGEHYDVEPGHYVMIAVSDSGAGMDKPTMARLFEPFFTTKALGKGTGLGLATVYGIVKQARGHVWVYSEQGRGTTFKVYLPELHAQPVAAPAPRPTSRPRHEGVVLVVEDEELVRATVCAILRREGYRVMAPETTSEALEIAQQGGRIDLILADVVMPELSGPELVARIREHHPTTPVLFMSGYTDVAVVSQGLPADAAFVQKPITPSSLGRKIRDVLARR